MSGTVVLRLPAGRLRTCSSSRRAGGPLAAPASRSRRRDAGADAASPASGPHYHRLTHGSGRRDSSTADVRGRALKPDVSSVMSDLLNGRDLSEACPRIAPGLIVRAANPFSRSACVAAGVKYMLDLRNEEEFEGELSDDNPWNGIQLVERAFLRQKEGSAKWETVAKSGLPAANETILLQRISILDRDRFQKGLLFKMNPFVVAQVLFYKVFDIDKMYDTIVKKMNAGGLELLYEVAMETSGPEFAAALDVILQAAEEGCPLLFFCKVGKDRTGLVAAMTLSVMGATREEIVQDYAKSDAHRDLALGGMEQKELKELDREIFRRAPAEAMEQTLDYVEKRYGSMTNYLVSVGFDLEKQGRLRRALSQEPDRVLHPAP